MSTHRLRRTAGISILLAGLLIGSGVSATATTPDGDDSPSLYVTSGDPDALAEFDVIAVEDGRAVVLGDAATATALAEAGLTIESRTTYAAAIGADSTRSPRTLSIASYPVPERLAGADYETFFGGYRTVAAHEQFLADVAASYPELVEYVDYGDSWLKTQGRGGHDLLAVRITAGADTDGSWESHDNGKPRFFLTAQAHAREIITSELAWRFIVELVDGYGTDPEITALLDSTEIWVGPNNNPDGTVIVEQALEDNPRLTAAGDANPVNTSQAWQRKNLNDTLFAPTGTNWSSQQPGIDLNRNWGEDWGGASTSSNPNATTYKGTEAFSEPEAAHQAALLTTLFGALRVGTDNPAPSDRTGVFINLHSYSNYVIYPYAYDWQATVPNLEEVRALGFRQSYFTGWNTGKAGEILYNNAGNDIDWIYANIGIPSYTWEIGTAATGGFFPAYSRTETFWATTRDALLYAAHAAGDPYRSPLGPSVTGATASWVGDGTVSVTGVVNADTFGNHPGAASRRPTASPVAAVEVVVGPTPTSAAARPAEVVVDGVAAVFTATLPPTGDAHARQNVFVRAQDEAGNWGPWLARWLEPVSTADGDGHELLIADVVPGTLVLEVPVGATALLSQVVLSGQDQLADGDLEPVTVLDGRGTSAGWVLSGQVSDFGAATGATILAANLGWVPEAAVLPGGLDLLVPESSAPAVSAGSAIAPGTVDGLSRPQSLASSPAGSSAGAFQVGAHVSLGVPAAAVAGLYTGVLTLTLI